MRPQAHVPTSESQALPRLTSKWSQRPWTCIRQRRRQTDPAVDIVTGRHRRRTLGFAAAPAAPNQPAEIESCFENNRHQFAPPSLDFQTPPLAAPAYDALPLVGSTASDLMRPAKFVGPAFRQPGLMIAAAQQPA